MARARNAGIPVMAIDIPMPGAVFFGADNYYAGRLAGEALGNWVNSNWDGAADAMLVLELPQSGPIPAARMQGMLDGFQDTVTTKLSDEQIYRLDSKNTQEESFRVVGDTLPSIPDATKIVAITINDGTALGAIAAAEAAGRKDQIMVVGQGADPSGQEEMVKDDSRYLGATGYFAEKYGDKLLPAMIDILECRPVAPAIYQDHVFITKENLCEFYADEQAAFCNP
jgi:ribose transport system substrate-binding protein